MLTALKTIGYCDIDIRDCVFFCVRKYQIPFAMNIPEEQIRDFDFFDHINMSTLRKAAWQALHIYSNIFALRRADQAISAMTAREPFDFYLFHGRCREADIIVSHRACRSFSYLEEGTLAYTGNYKLRCTLSRFRQRLAKLLFNSVFMGRAMLFDSKIAYDYGHKKYRTIYCCHPWAFPDRSDKKVMGLPFSETDEFPEDLQSLIVFDGGNFTVHDQKKSLRMNIEHAVGLGLKKVYYKFHPGFNAEIKSDYRHEFEKLSAEFNVQVAELPQTACLENIAYTLKERLALYIVCSSVGFYASLCGAKIYCTARHFIDENPAMQNFFQSLPPKLFDTYHFI